jgi:hypothetical protein
MSPPVSSECSTGPRVAHETRPMTVRTRWLTNGVGASCGHRPKLEGRLLTSPVETWRPGGAKEYVQWNLGSGLGKL